MQSGNEAAKMQQLYNRPLAELTSAPHTHTEVGIPGLLFDDWNAWFPLQR